MAWHKFLVAGLVGCGAIVGCTVTTTSDKGDGSAGITGTGGSGGGAASGGASGSGGAAASGGASASGGKTGSGGAAAAGGTDSGPPNGCTVCLQTKCAAEYTACKADPVCLSIKATGAQGEFPKTQTCMFGILGDGGAGVFTASDLSDCAGNSAADTSGVPSNATQDLITCMHGSDDASTEPCTTECFGDTVPFI